MLIPNRVNYPKCPHCDTTLNAMEYIPLSSLGSKYMDTVISPCCNEEIQVRVVVTFDIEVSKINTVDKKIGEIV